MLLVYTASIEEAPEQTRFEEIYYNYRKQMLLVAMRILHNKDDAEDAVQNALLGIAKHIKTVPTDTQRERAYVLTAAQNAALSMLPKKKEWDTMADISQLALAALEDVFETVASCQDYALLLRAIGQLKSPYLEVLNLIYVREMDIKTAADILCRKEETVRKQLLRGKKKLIELCEKGGCILNKNPLTPFQRALLETQLEEWQDIPAEKEIDLQLSEEFEKKGRALIRQVKQTEIKKMRVTVRRLVLIAAIIATLAITAFAIPAVREETIRFFAANAGTHYEFSFDPEQVASAPDYIEKVYKPTYIPEGFVQNTELIGHGSVCYIWLSGAKEYIAFDQMPIPNNYEGPQPDAEDVDMFIVNLNGYEVLELHCDGFTSYYWTNNEYLFILAFCPSVSQEDRVKVFCSVEYDKTITTK